MSKAKSSIISFEFFPPKTPENADKLYAAAEQLAKLNPDFFSVTFGAGGSTRDGTVQTVKQIQKQSNMTVAPHLSCIGMEKSQLIELLELYQTMNVTRIIALRGDLPSGMVNTGEIRYASELVSLIRSATGGYFHIDVAAYPEIHPQALSVKDDIQNLKRKFDAGANSAITQYFYNTDSYFYYLDECAQNKIDMPIIPGIMPISQFASLVRFSDMCGAEIPRWIRKRLEAYGDDLESIREFGLEVVGRLCQELIKGGAPGLHFYTLNNTEPTLSLVKQIALSVTPIRESV